MFEIILAVILGMLVGIFTGLIPGIHINLVFGIFLGSSMFLFEVSSFAAVAFIVAVAIMHTFIDFIPSIYLGAPNEDTALSTMPGHFNIPLLVRLLPFASWDSLFHSSCL